MPAGDGIETVWTELGRNRVTDTSVNGKAAGRGVGDKLIEHGRREIDSRHTVTEGCRGQRDVAGTGRDIEDIGGRIRKHRVQRINPSLVLHRAGLGHIAAVRLVVTCNRAPEAGDVSLDVVGIVHVPCSPIPADEFASMRRGGQQTLGGTMTRDAVFR